MCVNVWAWTFVSGDMRVWGFVSGDMRGGFGRSSLLMNLIGPTSAKQGRFLKVFKSAKRSPILDLRPGKLWEERRASAGGFWRDQIGQAKFSDISLHIIIFFSVMPSGFRSAYSIWSCKAWTEVLYSGGRWRRGDRGLPAQPRPPWHSNNSTKPLFRCGPVL
jgi:hypothetical protein